MPKRKRCAAALAPAAAAPRRVCPITLGPVRKAFAHDGHVFEAGALHDYLVSNPCAGNPITRTAIADEDRRALNARVGRGRVLLGAAAAEEGQLVMDRGKMSDFLGEEALQAVASFGRQMLEVAQEGLLDTEAHDDTLWHFWSRMTDIIADAETIGNWDFIRRVVVGRCEASFIWWPRVRCFVEAVLRGEHPVRDTDDDEDYDEEEDDEDEEDEEDDEDDDSPSPPPYAAISPAVLEVQSPPQPQPRQQQPQPRQPEAAAAISARPPSASGSPPRGP